MKSKLLEREAERTASDVVTDSGFASLPVDPFVVAEKHDILVRSNPSSTPGVSGYLVRVENHFGIQYATHIAVEGFIRFTVAHELGHFFLPGHPEHLFPHGDGAHASRSGFISGDKYERQADFFASAFLMPKILFLPALRMAGEGFPAIESLSATCKTSITATAIRYAKYSEDPVAIIVSSGTTVNYCFLSEPLRDIDGIDWLKKGTLLPPSSATARFNSSAKNIEDGERDEGFSLLSDWLDGAPEVEMKEDVVGLGSYGKALTVLHTSEAIDVDEEEEDDDYRFSPFRM